MYLRYILSLIIVLAFNQYISGMDYGLRFKSHSVPARERTSLPLGNAAYRFADSLSLGFRMNFYDEECFGLICTVHGDDGTVISLVSSSGDNDYQAGILINDCLHELNASFRPVDGEDPDADLTLDRKNGRVVFAYGGKRFAIPVNLSGMKGAAVVFGRTYEQSTTAPFDLRDVSVNADGKQMGSWELRTHQNDSTADMLNGNVLVATSPQWIQDDHTRWTELYHDKGADCVQTAFDPAAGVFYIVSPKGITMYDPATGRTSETPVENDGRVIAISNHLTFDTLTRQLVSYNMTERISSRYDFATGTWVGEASGESQPHFANHAYAEDSHNKAYLFGGYGFHLYNNKLMRMDLRTGAMESLALQPAPDPRMSASMCVVKDKLYIFGGFGNSSGKQEVPPTNYYDLWEYDINTLHGSKIGEIDSVRHHFLPSSSMYYSEADNSFYFASTLYGGCMMQLKLDPMSLEVVSEPIHSNMDYRDCSFSLYQGDDKRIYYLVINKTLDDYSHDLSIYRITYPFIPAVTDFNAPASGRGKSSGAWILWIVAGVAVVIAGGIYVARSRRAKNNGGKSDVNPHQGISTPNVKPAAVADSVPESDDDASSAAVAEDAGLLQLDNRADNGIMKDKTSTEHIKRDRSAISLLGKCEIRDKAGVDITTKLSPKMLRTLMMLILYSEKDEKGVNGLTIDAEVWPDKDEKSAKKNRNVCIYKLRTFMEEVGDVEISFERGYYRIEGNDVYIDYHEIMQYLRQFEQSDSLSGDDLERTIELLFFGPLLPSLTQEWLDGFKSGYTDYSLRILNKLLGKVRNVAGKESLAYKISETILLHDPLNEDAITTKCCILSRRQMKGPAREAYDRFCREYKKSYGEEYHVPFSTIIHSTGGC